MQVLIVYCHPQPESFCSALREAAVAGSERAGHDVTVLDLYGEGFRPAMSAAERRAYETEHPLVDPAISDHTEAVKAAEALVFVYPTWWWGLPATLKGWMDRVLVPGVAFTLEDDRVVPGLRRVRHLVGISTYGSTRIRMWLFTDAGRRTVLRTVRLLCHRRVRTRWLGLYDLDRSTDTRRRAFLAEVEETMARL